MSKKSSGGALVGLIVGVACLFIGLAALGLALMFKGDGESLIWTIVMFTGIGVAAVGLIVTVVSVIVGTGGKRKAQKAISENAANQESIPEVDMHLDGSATYYAPVSSDKYEFVTVGKRQSADEKFDQIGKMGKTQFVIYMAKLFSLKGYEVQLTPVIDNHGIDMLVKKDGITRAVGCLLANKIMCAEDVKPVMEGAAFYKVSGGLAVTNMYFDRSALEFAKSRKMTLIDRNILAEQFMN